MVADIFAAAGVTPAGVVRWGEPVALPASPVVAATGIYVVALTQHLDELDGCLLAAPISDAAVDELLDARAELTLDGVRPTRQRLLARLAAFWFPDEVVLYIGLAGPRRRRPAPGELAKRVGEYYATPLGARGPHAGGWPLKTIGCLGDLYVHYAYCEQVDAAEDAGIAHFAEGVSDDTRSRLYDPMRVMPFANLEFPKGNAKAHGIRGARAPRGRPRTAEHVKSDRRPRQEVARVAQDPDDLAEVAACGGRWVRSLHRGRQKSRQQRTVLRT